jgi:hypothetical protein
MVYIVLCDIMYNMELSHLYYHQYKMHIFWAVVIFHSAITVIMFSPLFLKRKIHFQIILCFYLLLIVQWIVLGYCVLSYIEHKTNPMNMPTLTKSYVQCSVEKSLGKLGKRNYVTLLLGVTFLFMLTYTFIRVAEK